MTSADEEHVCMLVLCVHIYIYNMYVCVRVCFFVQVLRFQLAHLEIQLRP